MQNQAAQRQIKSLLISQSHSSHQLRHDAPCAVFRQRVGKGYHPEGRGLFLSVSRSGREVYEQRDGWEIGCGFSLRVKVSGSFPRNDHSGRQSRPQFYEKKRYTQKGVVKSMILRFRRCKVKTAVNTSDSQELGGECDEF